MEWSFFPHRDLKCENILLDERGFIKLTGESSSWKRGEGDLLILPLLSSKGAGGPQDSRQQAQGVNMVPPTSQNCLGFQHQHHRVVFKHKSSFPASVTLPTAMRSVPAISPFSTLFHIWDRDAVTLPHHSQGKIQFQRKLASLLGATISGNVWTPNFTSLCR